MMSIPQADNVITVILPDQSQRQLPAGATGFDLAQDIAPSLAKSALAVKINEEIADLSTALPDRSHISILTRKSPEILTLIRHDAAHVMAEAVQRLFPGTQVTIGPAIENGFYYDFARETPFTPDDLAKIETEMHKIISENENFVREVWPREEAIAWFESKGESFKAEIIKDLPEAEPISIYRQGNWLDLCRGPHLPSTGHVGSAFKLLKLAGAYWRGDSRNPMLQRIYGTAWRDPKELKQYLTMLEEAQKRDHRRLGQEMDLFHLQEEAAGSIFWHPKGWALYRQVENYIRQRMEAYDYQEIKTPQLLDQEFWKKSGHWDKFREDMFAVPLQEDRLLALKPMNCPGHVQVFKTRQVSYKELPIKLSEFGSCHRNEPSGALHGIMRLRAFTQDDAHIFCREDQITQETIQFCELLRQVYRDFGFDDIVVKFSDRPENRAGEDAVWDRAEKALQEATQEAGLSVIHNPGEGAFYGPKLEFVLRDAIGRDWQCGTLQVDFVMPERLNAYYIGADNQKYRPVMLHRAILGSLERFIGILIEHYAGRFPLWLAPTQLVVATITDQGNDYAQDLLADFRKAGIRAEGDLRNEKISYKIREHSVKHVPLIVIVGQQEMETNSVTIRQLGQKEQKHLSRQDALAMIKDMTKSP